VRKGRGRLAAATLAGALAVTGCGRSERSAPRASEADAGPVFDVETMAFLSKARALHHEANLREEAGDLRGAAAQVERIVRANRPHPDHVVPEVEEVLADAWARLAELDVRIGELRGAAEAAKEGLTHARGPTYFRGHLLEVQGIAEESRAAALADGGDARGAEKARAAAMHLLEEAVAVQDQVIAEALDAGAGPSEGGRQ
jgi:hypothetical protein